MLTCKDVFLGVYRWLLRCALGGLYYRCSHSGASFINASLYILMSTVSSIRIIHGIYSPSRCLVVFVFLMKCIYIYVLYVHKLSNSICAAIYVHHVCILVIDLLHFTLNSVLRHTPTHTTHQGSWSLYTPMHNYTHLTHLHRHTHTHTLTRPWEEFLAGSDSYP